MNKRNQECKEATICTHVKVDPFKAINVQMSNNFNSTENYSCKCRCNKLGFRKLQKGYSTFTQIYMVNSCLRWHKGGRLDQ